MKKWMLWWQNVRTSVLTDLLLLLVITMAMFTLTQGCGIYRRMALTYDLVRSAGMNDRAVYYMDYFDPKGGPEGMVDAQNKRLALLEQLRQNPAVKTVYIDEFFSSRGLKSGSEGDSEFIFSTMICPETMRSLLPRLNRGQWFENAVNEDGSLNAIVCSGAFLGMPVGSKITVETQEHEPYTIQICGVLYEPSLVPSFSNSGTVPTTDELFSTKNVILVGESDRARELLVNSSDYRSGLCTSPNFIVDFQQDASDEAVQAVYQTLKSAGGLVTLPQLMDASKEWTALAFKIKMVRPIFFITLTFVAFFSITILYVLRRVQMYAVYYLVGYSKRRITWQVTRHVGAIISLATLINVFYLSRFYIWYMQGKIRIEGREPYYDTVSIWIIIAIAAVMFLVTLVAALGVLKKKSPVEFLRETKE